MQHTPDPRSSELRAWLEAGNRPRSLAGWLFHGARATHGAENTLHTRLSGLEIDDLDIDLSDPAHCDFGEYKLLARLGNGGMGVVYRARQLSLDRQVALKLLIAGPWANESFIERLRKEARHAARLAHPHIVSVFDIGQHDAFCFYTMRLVEGESLRERLARVGALDQAIAVRIAINIAQALVYAHGLGVLHLDIKPANILLDGHGDAHLADFGLARRFDLGADEGVDEIAGTPHYMAPEQTRSSTHALTPAADIFALGATLVEMLAGDPNLRADRSREVVRALSRRRRPRLGGESQLANRELEAICALCLAPDPAERYSSADAICADLKRWQLHRPVHAMRGGWPYRARKFVRRNRMTSALLGLIVAVVALAMAAMAWQIRQTAREAARTLQIKEQLIGLFLQPEDSKWATGNRTAREFLDQAAARLQTLAPGTQMRGELAGVVVAMYANFRDWQKAANLATAELGGMPIAPQRAARADLRLMTGWATAMWVTGITAGVLQPLASAVAHNETRNTKVYFDALVIATQVAIAEGDFAAAVKTGERALSLSRKQRMSLTTTIKARLELAAAYVGARNPDAGREQSEQALVEAGGADSAIHVYTTTMAGLRRALFGDFNAAQLAFDDGAAQWRRLGLPHLGEVFEIHSYAVNAFDLGHVDRATHIVDSLIAEPVALGPAFWLRGEIALNSKRYPDASTAFAECAVQLRTTAPSISVQARYCSALQVVSLARAGELDKSRSSLAIAQQHDEGLPRPNVASSMLLAAEAVLLSAEHQSDSADATFARALAELDAARVQAAVLEDQLKENRDRVRLRVWKAQAELESGHSRQAALSASEAHRIGVATLGLQHPFMRELADVETPLRGSR